jgi:sugar-specific transcriptional regulator TrmB
MEGFERLRDSLIQAKNVMNKVETGDFSKGNVNTATLTQDVNTPAPVAGSNQPLMSEEAMNRSVNRAHNPEKIKNSKLPENIKQLMLENPIDIPPLQVGSSGLSNEFIEEVSKKMEKENLKTPSRPIQENQTTSSLNESSIKELIRETIKESVQEIVSEELKKLTEGTLSLKENLQIRVGDSVFVGKITDVRKTK